MQTKLPDNVKETHWGQVADKILRSCVHCGFCTATCPTYQLLGDELDGPRGRIYQIKQFMENGVASRKTQQHLDRCLTCRSCETTCPSGVEYAHLLDIGREQLELALPRPPVQRLYRAALRTVFTSPFLFKSMLRVAKFFSFLLPDYIKLEIAENKNITPYSNSLGKTSERKMLLLEGCVQPELSPEINQATKRVLGFFGIDLINAPGCCGAIEHHLSSTEKAVQRVKNNIDHWYSYLDDGIEAIVSTASGCGVMVKDYDSILANDPEYLEKAQKIVQVTKDISEIVIEELNKLPLPSNNTMTIAFHAPCTLQHGQKLDGIVEDILEHIGFKLATVNDSHLCCGSAGTYSILQKTIAQQLRDNKLKNLLKERPLIIATANIGCLLHLRSGTDKPVVHWINLLDQYLAANS
ncbi:MAG: glycolate oxidase subunit GlcF [Gammaproteobacteria bacterium]|jgi:glycolate oxidase iron-sulfur subunit